MGSKLNVKQWAIASIAVFVGMSILEYIQHGLIMSLWYMETPRYWRPEEDMRNLMGWMYLGYAFYAVLFTLIYTKGYEGKPGVGEGIRYGLWMGLFVQLPRMFIMHAIYPYAAKILVGWLIYGVIESVILGAIVAMIYKKPEQTAAA